jgi:hypothetical protein
MFQMQQRIPRSIKQEQNLILYNSASIEHSLFFLLEAVVLKLSRGYETNIR